MESMSIDRILILLRIPQTLLLTFYMLIIVTFRYLSGVILEARKVLSEELTAIQKQKDGNDIMFQNFTEHMTKIKEAIKKVSVFGNCNSVAPDFSFLKFSYFFTVHLFI